MSPIGISTAELRANLGRRCGTLNDRASLCGGGQHAFEQHAREDQAGMAVMIGNAVAPLVTILVNGVSGALGPI